MHVNATKMYVQFLIQFTWNLLFLCIVNLEHCSSWFSWQIFLWTWELKRIILVLRYLDSSIRKAKWAHWIIEQWQWICNFKVNNTGETRHHVITCTLMDMTDEYLCATLCKFLVKIKKQNGELYPKETLYGIVLALQSHLEMNGQSVKFLENEKFKPVLNALDNTVKLRSVLTTRMILNICFTRSNVQRTTKVVCALWTKSPKKFVHMKTKWILSDA